MRLVDVAGESWLPYGIKIYHPLSHCLKTSPVVVLGLPRHYFSDLGRLTILNQSANFSDTSSVNIQRLNCRGSVVRSTEYRMEHPFGYGFNNGKNLLSNPLKQV